MRSDNTYNNNSSVKNITPLLLVRRSDNTDNNSSAKKKNSFTPC
jgi:hypothetical protein